jgi:hypothetical protein
MAMISNALDWIAHRGSNDTNSWLLSLFCSGVTVVHLLQEVLARMAGALFFRRDLFSEVESKPDLYGPFWISTTCIFLMAMISNALDWIAHRGGDSHAWKGDLDKIVYSAAIMYGYVFGAGLVLWVWLKVISLAAISLSALWCIYGASKSSFNF